MTYAIKLIQSYCWLELLPLPPLGSTIQVLWCPHLNHFNNWIFSTNDVEYFHFNFKHVLVGYLGEEVKLYNALETHILLNKGNFIKAFIIIWG